MIGQANKGQDMCLCATSLCGESKSKASPEKLFYNPHYGLWPKKITLYMFRAHNQTQKACGNFQGLQSEGQGLAYLSLS